MIILFFFVHSLLMLNETCPASSVCEVRVSREVTACLSCVAEKKKGKSGLDRICYIVFLSVCRVQVFFFRVHVDASFSLYNKTRSPSELVHTPVSVSLSGQHDYRVLYIHGRTVGRCACRWEVVPGACLNQSCVRPVGRGSACRSKQCLCIR